MFCIQNTKQSACLAAEVGGHGSAPWQRQEYRLRITTNSATAGATELPTVMHFTRIS